MWKAPNHNFHGRFKYGDCTNGNISTVKQCLREAGLNVLVAVKESLLQSVNEITRLQRVRGYKRWTVHDWQKVLIGTTNQKLKVLAVGIECSVMI